jgi:carbon monoxide dehydrogenase subunit G
MNIEGTYTFQSRLAEIRQSLTKQAILQHTIPGLEKLEAVETNCYAVAIHIKYPPLAGTYHGQVSIVEDQQTAAYRFSIESNGSSNTITGVGNIQLHELGDNTTVIYKGTLSLSKHGTRLNPAVTRGAVKLLIQRFFTSLSDQLRSNYGPITENGTHTDTDADIVIHRSMPLEQRTPPSFAYKIVRVLGLGKGDAQQEEVWTQRIRQAGLISSFLLLVWIGTRLPRKRSSR